MSCIWCESDENELIKYCAFEHHRVCVLCYERYRERYPLRVEGCPYCKGIEDKMVVYVRNTREMRNVHRIYSETAFANISIFLAGAVFFVGTFGVMYWYWFS